MKAKEIALVYLMLGKIHAAILDGIIEQGELLACPHVAVLLIMIYKSVDTIPASYFVVVYDIRVALLKRSISPVIVVTHLQPILDTIHKRKRHTFP